MQVYMYACTHAHVYVHTNTHTHIRTHTHIFTHTLQRYNLLLFFGFSGSVVGYHVLTPCRKCMRSCNNGHFWMFHSNCVSACGRMNLRGTVLLLKMWLVCFQNVILITMITNYIYQLVYRMKKYELTTLHCDNKKIKIPIKFVKMDKYIIISTFNHETFLNRHTEKYIRQ